MSDLLSRPAPGKCLNKVTLVGNLGDDPETRFTPSGTQVTTARLATDESWTDRKGGRRRRTEWHRLVLWRRLAEVASQHLRKGVRLHVEGRLQTRKWEDGKGRRHSVTEIVVTDLRFVDGAGGARRARSPLRAGGGGGARHDGHPFPGSAGGRRAAVLRPLPPARRGRMGCGG